MGIINGNAITGKSSLTFFWRMRKLIDYLNLVVNRNSYGK